MSKELEALQRLLDALIFERQEHARRFITEREKFEHGDQILSKSIDRIDREIAKLKLEGQ